MSEAERDPHFLGEITTFTYDPEGNLISVEAPAPPGSKWEHDEAKRLFRITQPDGKVIEFHDRASASWSSPQIRRRESWRRRRHGECPGSCICAGKRGCNG